MPIVEVCSYRLSLRGKPVGSQVLRTVDQGQTIWLETKVMLQGGLGQHTITQQSLLSRQTLVSLRFREEVVSASERRQYRLDFDADEGLVKASRGSGDYAEAPYLRPYQDPLGLLYQVRQLGGAEQARVPMLGKDVIVEQLGSTTLETALGERAVRVYSLYPGGSYVYVDRAPPFALLKMVQRSEQGVIEALLVRLEEEEADAAGEGDASRGGRKRRRKRKRRRRARD
jgi:hypothetical protein